VTVAAARRFRRPKNIGDSTRMTFWEALLVGIGVAAAIVAGMALYEKFKPGLVRARGAYILLPLCGFGIVLAAYFAGGGGGGAAVILSALIGAWATGKLHFSKNRDDVEPPDKPSPGEPSQ
jgi:hypothetical protein